MRRVALLAASLTGLVALEFSLRLYAALTRRAPVVAAGGAPLVWCAGDSNTAGDGAPLGRGYPEQLEEISKAAGAPLRVVNLGVPGGNSSGALKLIRERLLAGERPSVVVALFGENDRWNLSNVETPSALGALQRLKIAQLMRGLALRAAGPRPLDLAYAGRWSELRAALPLERRRTRDEQLLLAMAAVFLGEFQEARDRFEAFLRAPASRSGLAPVAHEAIVRDELARLAWFENPESVTRPLFERLPDRELDDRTLARLGAGWWRLQNNNILAAEREFHRLLAEPELEPLERAFAREGLGWAALTRGDKPAARALFALAIKDGGEDRPDGVRRLFAAHAGLSLTAGASWRDVNPRASRALAQWKQAAVAGAPRALPPVSYMHLGVGRWLRANLEQKQALELLERNHDALAALAEEHGFRLYVMTYPQFVAQDVNARAREAARRARRPLVDLAALFEALPAAEAATLVSGDKYHPNEAGYGRIARRVFEAISASPPSRTASPPERR